MLLCRHLRAAFYQFRRRGHDEGRQTACCACEPDFREGFGRIGRGEEAECAIVCYEEQGIEGAVAEDGCCGAYTGDVLLGLEPGEVVGWGICYL